VTRAIERALAPLTGQERRTLGALAEKVLRSFVADLDHAYSVCRLCAYDACTECPVDDELGRRERQELAESTN
jgi:hypothetical protein